MILTTHVGIDIGRNMAMVGVCGWRFVSLYKHIDGSGYELMQNIDAMVSEFLLVANPDRIGMRYSCTIPKVYLHMGGKQNFQTNKVTSEMTAYMKAAIGKIGGVVDEMLDSRARSLIYLDGGAKKEQVCKILSEKIWPDIPRLPRGAVNHHIADAITFALAGKQMSDGLSIWQYLDMINYINRKDGE